MGLVTSTDMVTELPFSVSGGNLSFTRFSSMCLLPPNIFVMDSTIEIGAAFSEMGTRATVAPANVCCKKFRREVTAKVLVTFLGNLSNLRFPGRTVQSLPRIGERLELSVLCGSMVALCFED